MQLRPCPYCQKPIPRKMTACPYCHHNEEGQKVRMDTAQAPPENGEKYFENDMADLSNEDPFIREQAVVRMAQKGFGVVQALIDVLSNLNHPGLTATAKVLGRVRDKRSLPALTNALRIGDEDLKVTAAWALGQIREPEVAALFVTEIERQHPSIQSYMAFILGSMRDVKAIAPLGKLVRHANREVAFHAACALGDIGDAQAAVSLKAGLGHKEAIVRQAAMASLKRLGVAPKNFSWWKWAVGILLVIGSAVGVYVYR